MIDRVKNAVVNLGLQIGWIEGNDNHKFPGWKNVTDAMKEAQALLKEQEAVTEYGEAARQLLKGENVTI